MKIIIRPDYESLSRTAADLVQAVVAVNPKATLLLATGNTPVGLYRELAKHHARGEFDASQTTIVQLDAYLELAPDDERSLYGWLDREFLAPQGIPPSNVIRLPGDTADPEDTCREFDRALAQAGGVDLSVLGLGPNGHLGFNEPPCAADAPTRIVALTPESIVSNARYWGRADRVPTRAITAGMSDLLAARATLLLVSGAHKREILSETIHGPITGHVPASYLQNAANVTVLADRDALPSASGDAR
ncbi:glucosamine-6-phosphate deaminase [Capsulimonas corticalis]|uniref:Glucosamine-6-phosphate deaminase n=1 Tax=Capsulimonas corticalis TaxID=2219043 RepID=A0A402D684_9BACT|nr:glucosamine-6-phosphate deaminase [Capsulimonas corticalis]BDI32048.1 glucosamine-6-phosphate deaminase [Capsulimonas corticalis]